MVTIVNVMVGMGIYYGDGKCDGDGDTKKKTIPFNSNSFLYAAPVIIHLYQCKLGSKQHHLWSYVQVPSIPTPLLRDEEPAPKGLTSDAQVRAYHTIDEAYR